MPKKAEKSPLKAQKDQQILLCHVGFHRCGSSSIQQALRTARPSIEAHGWTLLLREDLKRAKALLGFRRGHWRDAWLPTGWLRLIRLLVAIWPVKGSILLSEENLLGHMPGALSDNIYPRAIPALTFLRFIAFITGRQLLVVAVTRDEAAWQRSLWAFRRTRRENRDEQTFKAALTGALNQTVERLRAILGDKLTVIPLEELSDSAFKAAFHLPEASKVALGQQNRSLPNIALLAYDALKEGDYPLNDDVFRESVLKRLPGITSREDYAAFSSYLESLGYAPLPKL